MAFQRTAKTLLPHAIPSYIGKEQNQNAIAG